MSVFDSIDSLPSDPVALKAALVEARSLYEALLAERDQLRDALAQAADTRKQGSAPSLSSSRGKTVIVIDDSKVMQMRMRSLLVGYGWDLIGVAENGAFGADLVLTRNPCVVLLDYDMPVMNGVETLAEIRRVDKEVRVIVVSGTLTTELLQTLLQTGANDILVKPINESKLHEALERCL